MAANQQQTLALSDGVRQEYSQRVPNLDGPEKYHVFISHSSEDVDYSKFLKEQIESITGYKCFHSDDDFTPGVTIISNIIKGINMSRRVVVIISQHMMESKWVEFEVANTRTKANEKGKAILIPVLYNIKPEAVPAYVKEINYIQADDPQFWPKMLKSLTEDIPLTATIPAGNIAHGISWSYYYGYLSLVLPGLVERTMQSEFARKGCDILPIMLIILPESCNCPPDVKQVDPNVTFQGVVKCRRSRAGKLDRDYDSPVFLVEDPRNGEKFYTIMEYATPLLAMYEMEQGRIANLDRQEKLRQMLLFKEKMEEIISHPSNKACHNKSVLITFKDGGDDKQRLAEILADTIRRELHMRKFDTAQEQQSSNN